MEQVQIIIDKIDSIAGRLSRLDTRLDVHDQKHQSLDKEHKEFADLVKEHGKRLAQVEVTSQQNKRDIERLTTLQEKLIWAFAAPMITASMGGLIWAISQVMK
jgi:septal ring factor EnvC (AmiA/AmiB activator)